MKNHYLFLFIFLGVGRITLNLAPWLGLEKDLPMLPLTAMISELYEKPSGKLDRIVEEDENEEDD